jgi:hypothetical protein
VGLRCERERSDHRGDAAPVNRTCGLLDVAMMKTGSVNRSTIRPAGARSGS